MIENLRKAHNQLVVQQQHLNPVIQQAIAMTLILLEKGLITNEEISEKLKELEQSHIVKSKSDTKGSVLQPKERGANEDSKRTG